MPSVVFVTAFDQYALRAFEVHALDYLLKPFEADRFHNALVRARANLSPAREASYPGEDRLRRLLAEVLGAGQGREGESVARTPSPYFERVAVKTDGATRILQIADVDWFETDGNYVRVHVGKSTYLIRSTANRLQEELDPRRFARIHRRFLVNVDRVVGLEPWFGGDAIVLLRDGSKLRLSRNYREGFLALMLGDHSEALEREER
jgi:two-component system LytT family response regulator